MKSFYLKTSLYGVITTVLLLCVSQNHAQQYYKWVDANGSTHYTTTPPPKNAKRLDKISTYGSSHQTTSAPANQNAQEVASNTSPSVPKTTSETTETTIQPPVEAGQSSTVSKPAR